eukprot:CAMPEP_0118935440 /NCGR_PEP_ID=MMETSP1169-20130426/15642_1 /TAXON_ID=36882 /ORGANISM="Pyramimonas obovata, Strain CCMP722" /LENGTH=1049 /DNA_ID=CAMNT_0006878481 /DNA_START=130 /DNA_END=3279 /DNA_ORIENTATION=-
MALRLGATPAVGLLLLLAHQVAGSHFRYGTINYVPTDTPVDSSGKKEVQITFEAVFRRDYKWGVFQEEQWQQQINYQPPDPLAWRNRDLPEYNNNQYDEVTNPTGGRTTNPNFDSREFQFDFDFNNNGKPGEIFYMRFPPLTGSRAFKLADGESVQPCPDPYYCDMLRVGCTKDDYDFTALGDDGEPLLPPPAKDPNGYCAWDPLGENGVPWDPSRCGEWHGWKYTSANTRSVKDQWAGSFRVANYTSYFDVSLGLGKEGPYGMPVSGTCAQWSTLYGMFLGDGTAVPTTLTSTEIEYSCASSLKCDDAPNALGCDEMAPNCNSVTGNFIRGREVFTHSYLVDSPRPFLGFFAGGNRIYECYYDDQNRATTGLSDAGLCGAEAGGDHTDLERQLNNNAEGRYRLEFEVWLRSADLFNESPVVAQEAVLPVVRSGSYDERTPFQIPSYDQNVGDYLVFRFGSRDEMGGITRSKETMFPPPSPAADRPGVTYTSDVEFFSQYGDRGCTLYTRTVQDSGRCPQDRTPFKIWGTEEFSFTSDVPGLVEWRTYYPQNPTAADNVPPGKGGQPLPEGLYNMVVMVHDVALSIDVNGTPSEAPVMDTYRREGHAVFDQRYQQTFTYKVKVPLDYMLYLYTGPMGFCNKGCKDNKEHDLASSLQGEANAPADNAYPGIPTFADVEGVYGQSADRVVVEGLAGAYPAAGFSAADGYAGMDAFLRLNDQQCRICSYGTQSVECVPFAADGVCGVAAGGSLVPTADACKLNTRPYFTRHARAPAPAPGAAAPNYGNWDWLDEEWVCRSATSTAELTCYCTANANCTAFEVPRELERFTPAAVYAVENNPGVEDWYHNTEHVKLVVPTGSGDFLASTERFPFALPGGVETGYVLTPLTRFQGEDFEFIITAKDDDDCAELTLRTSGLPASRDTVVEGVQVDGMQATLFGAEFITDYPEFPQGIMLRRRFLWRAPPQSQFGGQYDTRQPLSVVCFSANDGYLLTNEPLYCVALRIVERPIVVEELQDCYCRTCVHEGARGNPEARPVPNYAPKKEEYKAAVY